jgi:hypothetical protein
MNYLQDQAVMNFAGTAARGSAIGTAVSEGMVSYLNDTDNLEVYRTIGTAAPGWNPVAFRSEVEAIPSVGYVPVIAPTVNFSGGTATANSLGIVSFTGVTSISLNGVFTSQYRNYRILSTSTPTGGSPLVQLRFRTSGTDFSAGSHNSSGVNVTAASITAVNNAGATGWNVILSSNLFYSGLTLEVFNPQLAQQTNIQYASYGISGGSNNSLQVTGIVTATNQFDGFTLTPNSNSFTGTIQVFGYNS